MRNRLIISLTTALLLAGCQAGSPGSISMDSPEQLKAEHDISLCRAYGMLHGDAVKAEIQRRKLLTDDQWKGVAAETTGVGDSACEALMAWGPPTQINSTTTAAGTSEQWVYQHFGGGMSFLYVDGGVVTAIQN